MIWFDEAYLETSSRSIDRSQACNIRLINILRYYPEKGPGISGQTAPAPVLPRSGLSAYPARPTFQREVWQAD